MNNSGFRYYARVFNPSSPMASQELLVGRDEERFVLAKAIERQGQHAVVFGDRGIGKTSLSDVVTNQCGQTIIKLQCGADWSFLDFSYQFLKSLGKSPDILEEETSNESSISPKFDVKIVSLGGDKKESSKVKYKGLHGTTWNASSLIQELRGYEEPSVIVLDEYDLINSSGDEFHREISHFIKGISNDPAGLPFTFIIIGIASSAANLLAGHKSSGRNLQEIFLKWIPREGIGQFLRASEKILNIKFSNDVFRRLVNSSYGLPYQVHLLCECICDSIVIENPDVLASGNIVHIDARSYVNGIRRAVETKYQDMKEKYAANLNKIGSQGKQVVKFSSLFSDEGIRDVESLSKVLVGGGYLSEGTFMKGLDQLNKANLPYKFGAKYLKISDPLFLSFSRKYYWGDAAPEVASIQQGNLDF